MGATLSDASDKVAPMPAHYCFTEFPTENDDRYFLYKTNSYLYLIADIAGLFRETLIGARPAIAGSTPSSAKSVRNRFNITYLVVILHFQENNQP